MNPEELQSVAEEAICRKPFSYHKTFHLCHWDGHLMCLPLKHTNKKHPIFCQLTHKDCYVGMTSAKWNLIGDELKKYYKEKTPCTQPTVR